MEVVLQSEAAECGLACAAMILGYQGCDISLPQLRKGFPPSRNGISLWRLSVILEHFGLRTRAVSLEIEELSSLRLPCIAHWRAGHFVVIEKVGCGVIAIVDPMRDRRIIGMPEMEVEFTGVALEAVRY